MVTFLFCVVIARLFYVQVVWGVDLQSRAIDQWTRELPVVAARGKITDRSGVVLVDNLDTYSVFVRPNAVKDKAAAASLLAKLLSLNEEELYQKLAKSKVSELTVKKHVDKQTVLALSKNAISGVYFARDNSRVYPYGEFLTQVLGFTSTDGAGQSGIELYQNANLKGTDGEILYQTDLVGKEISQSAAYYYPAKNGLTVELTVDYEIQTVAERAMREAMLTYTPKSAACVVMDVTSGEVLALSIQPSYDLNNPPREDLSKLMDVSRNLLITDVYEPGSTFKIITTAANIEEYHKGNANALSSSYVFPSSRTRQVAGTTVKCWSTHANGKHSSQTLQDALNNSCNPCFVDIGLRLGTEKMYEYLGKFGFGKKTGIDFGGEAHGLLVPQSAVTLSDLARISFGQTIAVTPIQLAAAVSAAVNGGYYYEPYFIRKIRDEQGNPVSVHYPNMKNRTISEESSKQLALLLEGVVANGSGKKAFVAGYRVGGKTGTAQKYENGKIAQGKYVSSFVGFFPANAPKYLCLVVIDEPVGQSYGSVVAAPYAGEIFQGIISAKKMQPCL